MAHPFSKGTQNYNDTCTNTSAHIDEPLLIHRHHQAPCISMQNSGGHRTRPTRKFRGRERETERKSGIALFFFTTLGPPSPRTATIRGGHGCGHHDREQMVEMAVFEGNYGIFVIAPLTAPMYCVKLYRDLGGSTYYVLDCHINTCKARNFLKFSSS